MPRGGKREGAGRKSKGNHLNPYSIEQIKQKIRAHHLIKRLGEHIDSSASTENGSIVGTMAPSAVTAALGLLRKILPDISEQTIDVTSTNYDISGEPEPTADEWKDKHVTEH